MRIDKTLVRAFALFKYFKKDYPNFDGYIPDDEFYYRFKKMTGLTLSSFNYFKTDLALLGIILREGKYNKLNPNKVNEFNKQLLKIEKEEAERLYAKAK